MHARTHAHTCRLWAELELFSRRVDTAVLDKATMEKVCVFV